MKQAINESNHVFFSADAKATMYDDGSFDVEFPSGLKICMPHRLPDRQEFDELALQLSKLVEQHSHERV